MNLTVLDTGPLGMISNPNGKPANVRCLHWARSLVSAGHRVIIPEIADYEIRRELLRLGRLKGLKRLDSLKSVFYYAPLMTDSILKAAELWADVRRKGLPTASPDALDADAILAAQALTACGQGDTVVVATSNVGHLGRFVDARIWDQITP
jgi:predicted nucleic acid-binding protein